MNQLELEEIQIKAGTHPEFLKRLQQARDTHQERLDRATVECQFAVHRTHHELESIKLENEHEFLDTRFRMRMERVRKAQRALFQLRAEQRKLRPRATPNGSMEPFVDSQLALSGTPLARQFITKRRKRNKNVAADLRLIATKVGLPVLCPDALTATEIQHDLIAIQQASSGYLHHQQQQQQQQVSARSRAHTAPSGPTPHAHLARAVASTIVAPQAQPGPVTGSYDPRTVLATSWPEAAAAATTATAATAAQPGPLPLLGPVPAAKRKPATGVAVAPASYDYEPLAHQSMHRIPPVPPPFGPSTWNGGYGTVPPMPSPPPMTHMYHSSAAAGVSATLSATVLPAIAPIGNPNLPVKTSRSGSVWATQSQLHYYGRVIPIGSEMVVSDRTTNARFTVKYSGAVGSETVWMRPDGSKKRVPLHLLDDGQVVILEPRAAAVPPPVNGHPIAMQ
ncbi:hypothetical protein BC828DRAFT_271653 [Blastocladiella britannica]|nr:hypothetical protein BC828DRAFT_271653 [Blastocladiella britannica]